MNSATAPLLPVPTPETRFFWEGTRAGELRFQRCTECATAIFPPRPFCPKCLSTRLEVERSKGFSVLLTYIISHLPAPGFSTPYSIGVVRLDEGPQMLTNIVNCPQTPESIDIDMRLQVIFRKASEEIWLPLFEPLHSSSGERQ